MEGLGVWSLRNPHESGFIHIQVGDDDCEASPLLGYEHVTQIKTSVGLKKFCYTHHLAILILVLSFLTPRFYLQK